MYKGKIILALIPARGGSKGLPRKNIRMFSGDPLIGRSIKQAKASKYLDRIVVSTDDREIAGIAERYGAEVPFLRPGELATDSAKAIDVIFHALDCIEKSGDRFDLLVLLQATSPLREAADIDRAIELLYSKEAKAVVSVCAAEHHPYWMMTLSMNGALESGLKPDAQNMNRQELPEYFLVNGAVYAVVPNYLRENNGFMGKETFAYEMPPERSVDIDNELDFKFAEFIAGERKE